MRILSVGIAVAALAAAAGGRAGESGVDAAALARRVSPSVVRLSALGKPREHPLAAGTKAPAVKAVSVDGAHRPIAVDVAGGVPTVVNFWASWCAPCVAEMPELAKAAERWRGRVRFVGLASADSPDADIAAIVKKTGVSYDVLRADEDTARAWGVSALPSSFVVDGAGVVRWSGLGGLAAADVDLALVSVLGGAPAEVPGEAALGVGFAVGKDVVATARDVVTQGGDALVAVTADGKAHPAVALLADDEASGVALLKVDADLAPLPLAAQAGDAVLAAGIVPDAVADGAPAGTPLVDASGAVVGMQLDQGVVSADALRTLVANTDLSARGKTLGPDVHKNLVVSAVFFGVIALGFAVPVVVGRLRNRRRSARRFPPTTLH